MAKKDKTAKLPKHLAGVKVPKALRVQGGNLAKFARNPIVADLLAAGLVALAATLRGGDKPAKAPKAVKTDGVTEKVVEAAAAVAEVVKPVPKPRKAPAAKPAKAAKPAAAKKPRAPANTQKPPRRPPSKTTH